MYQITLTVGARYRRGVRRQLQEMGLNFTEDRGFRASRLVIHTPCKELHDLLVDGIGEDAARTARR